MTTKYYNKTIGSCESGITDVITQTDNRYEFVKEQLTIAINTNKSFVDNMCKNLLDHNFILNNLHNIILVRDQQDENHILGFAAYDIIEFRLQKILKLYTLCTNNKCGTMIIELIKYIGEVENCDCIKVISISPSIGFYWRMGFRFLIENRCLFYSDNELARHQRQRFEETGEVLLEENVVEELEKYKLAWYKDDNYIMTYCLKFEDEYAYEED